MMIKYKNNNRAFTLAEVLITLAIIGVVASMSIPALKKSIDESRYISMLKKDYSVIEQASRRVLQDVGGSFYGEYDGYSHAKLKNAFSKYLTYTKECNRGSDCYSEKRYFVGGQEAPYISNNWAVLELADGSIFNFYAYDSCESTIDGAADRDKVCGQIIIDVNGEKGPNITSKDVFKVFILKDRIVPSGSSYLQNEGYPKCGCTAGACGVTCTAKYLYEK